MHAIWAVAFVARLRRCFGVGQMILYQRPFETDVTDKTRLQLAL